MLEILMTTLQPWRVMSQMMYLKISTPVIGRLVPSSKASSLPTIPPVVYLLHLLKMHTQTQV